MTADLTPREVVARALADDWNPDRDPILTAMFRDYAQTALTALADHPGLVEVLWGHQVAYHSITKMLECLDPACGFIDRNVPDLEALRAAPAAHLADVIRAWLRGAS